MRRPRGHGGTWDPEEHAAACGITVVTHRLVRAWGAYVPERRLIVLHPGMRPALRRWTLAHELGHHERGDGSCADTARAARAERKAEEWVAARLVDPAAWDLAVRTYEHAAQVAAELAIPTHAVAVCAELFAGEPART